MTQDHEEAVGTLMRQASAAIAAVCAAMPVDDALMLSRIMAVAAGIAAAEAAWPSQETAAAVLRTIGVFVTGATVVHTTTLMERMSCAGSA